MAAPGEYVAIDPSIVIAANPDGTPAIAEAIQLMCFSNRVALTPEDTEADADTFCNPEGVIPGSTAWTCQVDVLLSFTDGSDVGSWNLLHPLRRTRQTIELMPKDDVVSDGNPLASFDVWIPSIPFIDNTRGETFRFTFEPKVIGEPVFATEPEV